MICKKCNYNNRDDATYCGKCGCKLQDEDDFVYQDVEFSEDDYVDDFELESINFIDNDDESTYSKYENKDTDNSYYDINKNTYSEDEEDDDIYNTHDKSKKIIIHGKKSSNNNNNKHSKIDFNNLIKCVAVICALLIVFMIVKTVKGGSDSAQSDYDTTVLSSNDTKVERVELEEKESNTEKSKETEKTSTSSNQQKTTSKSYTERKVEFSDISIYNNQDNFYYASPDDFEFVNTGRYSFAYPSEYYNYAEKTENGYYLSADNGAYFNISVEDVNIRKSQITSVMNKFYNQAMSSFYSPEEIIYNDSTDYPYRRCIVMGYSDSNESIKAYFFCNVYPDRIEKFTIEIPMEGYMGEEDSANYLIDTMYRACSFSGSSYKPRTYDLFINKIVGTKK